jgi:hypothetical protein
MGKKDVLLVNYVKPYAPHKQSQLNPLPEKTVVEKQLDMISI